MSKTQLLKTLINERLSAAAMEIFDVVERTIAEYEEQVRYSKRENARQRDLFNKLLKPELKLHRSDPQKYTLPKQKVPPEQQHCEQERSPSLDQEDPEPPQIKEEVPPEQHHCEQERSPSLDQEDPEPPQIKEEQDGLWTSEEGEKLKNLKEEETDTKNSMFSVMCVESILDQGQTQFHHLDKSLAMPSTDQMTTEPDGGDCGVSEPDSSITESKDSEWTLSGDKPYNSSVCSRGFRVKSSLKHHMVSHTGAKPFSCSVCGNGFSYKTNLTRHMLIHSREKPFKCSLCSKGFKRKSSLDYHMWTHTRENRHSCKVCEKGFYNKGNLTIHMRSHTGENPFKCVFCSKGFKIKCNLKSHMMIHTKEDLKVAVSVGKDSNLKVF